MYLVRTAARSTIFFAVMVPSFTAALFILAATGQQWHVGRAVNRSLRRLIAGVARREGFVKYTNRSGPFCRRVGLPVSDVMVLPYIFESCFFCFLILLLYSMAVTLLVMSVSGVARKGHQNINKRSTPAHQSVSR